MDHFFRFKANESIQTDFYHTSRVEIIDTMYENDGSRRVLLEDVFLLLQWTDMHSCSPLEMGR